MDKIIDWIVSADSTTIAAIVAAVAAIIAPITTSFITQRSAYKLKSLELFFNEKSRAYKNLLNLFSFLPSELLEEDIHELREATAFAMLFSSHSTRTIISDCSTAMIESNGSKDACEKVSVLQEKALIAMQSEIDKFKK